MIEIKGLKKVVKQLKNLGDVGKKRIDETTEVIAQDIEKDAKSYAPVDTGKLRQSILAIKQGYADYKIYANATGNAPYAAYIEFGTGGLVSVPDELKEMAIKFKGKGIRQVNLPAKPYLYPALQKNRLRYVEQLEQDLDELTR